MIFANCEECGEELNEMEQEFCDKKYLEIGMLKAICSECLSKNYEGKFPYLPKK